MTNVFQNLAVVAAATSAFGSVGLKVFSHYVNVRSADQRQSKREAEARVLATCRTAPTHTEKSYGFERWAREEARSSTRKNFRFLARIPSFDPSRLSLDLVNPDAQLWHKTELSTDDLISAALLHLTSRLGSVISAKEKYNRIALTFKAMNGFLLFGQYVVGAALGTSLLKVGLNQQVVGVLGAFVVVSAAIRQRYQPDTVATDATTKAVILEALVSDTEDRLLKIVCDGLDDTSPEAINCLSRELSAVLKQLKLGIPIPRSKTDYRRSQRPTSKRKTQLDED